MSLPLYVKAVHTADKAAAVTGQVIIYGVQVSANGNNADVELCDALTDGSEDDLVFNVLDGDTRLFDYTPFGGVVFNTGLTVDATANTTIVIWTDVQQVPT